MSPDDTGLRRIRAGRGFRYLGADDEPVAPQDVERIKALAIPPAWNDVWICRFANGHIQAVGTDARGRRQYLYHDEWRRQRDQAKHERVLRVAKRLPKAREGVAGQLATTGMPWARAMATAFRLLDLGYFRIGSDSYATENGSFGLTTLRREHVILQRRRLVFEFAAKSGVMQQVEIADRQVAAAVEMMRRRRSGADELLAWRDRRVWRRIEAAEVNDYLKDLLAEDVSAKDFRTWHGTVHAAVALAQEPAPESKAAGRRSVAVAMRAVADHLGNTPAVARASYVDPRLVDRFLDGQTIARGLSRAERFGQHDPRHQLTLERAVLRLLGDN